jgi:hypothetical protein
VALYATTYGVAAALKTFNMYKTRRVHAEKVLIKTDTYARHVPL